MIPSYSACTADEKDKGDPESSSHASTPICCTPRHQESILDQVFAAGGHEDDHKGHRVIYSDMKEREVSTKHTVCSIFLGEGTRAEALVFHLGVREAHATAFLWGMWYIGTAVGVLAVGRVVHTDYVWASVLMLPLPLVAMPNLSIDLLKEIMMSMDIYVITILQVAWLLDGIYYCKADIRSVFWLCYLPTMVVSGLVDAYPAKYRAFFAKLFYSAAIVILLVWNWWLFFRWNAFGKLDSLKYIAMATHHFSDQLALLVMFIRHLWFSIFCPWHFVFIKAEVLTGHQIDGTITTSLMMGQSRRQSVP